MSPKKFITLIKTAVSDAAIEDTVSILVSPPGKKPAPRLVEISSFYNQQSAEGKACIEKIITESVEQAVFGFLCVLDGVRSIEESKDKGVLSLSHEGRQATKLNTDGNLHDLYSQQLIGD